MFSFRSTAYLAASAVLLGSTACTVPIDMDDQSALVGTVWELQQIQFNDDTLLVAEPPSNYTIEFTDAGEVFVQADCNRAAGAFTLEDGMIAITLGPTTLAACPEGSIDTEFIRSLNSANILFFQGNDLFIDLAFDSGTMQFSPAPDMELTGQVWEMQEILFNDDSRVVPDDPANYTVQFLDDGTLLVQADCNQGRGSFTATADRSLEISPIATTMMACPEGSVGNDFVQALSDGAIYFFQDGQLFIDIRFGSGTMRLAPATNPPLLGTTWKLQQIQFNDDTLLVPDAPDRYTVEFMSDGSVVVQADCNRGQGSFGLTDNRITISNLATTRAACPEGSIGNEFVRSLESAGLFFFQDGNLFVDLAFDSGTMQFSAD